MSSVVCSHEPLIRVTIFWPGGLLSLIIWKYYSLIRSANSFSLFCPLQVFYLFHTHTCVSGCMGISSHWWTYTYTCNLSFTFPVVCLTWQDIEIRTNAGLYLPQISDLLNRVPRQMLLLLKTNDLLRGIETTLQTRASSSSFINMSRCCIRAIAR